MYLLLMEQVLSWLYLLMIREILSLRKKYSLPIVEVISKDGKSSETAMETGL